VLAQAFPIQHIVVIMQENRSFDSYFGTYPGANGIPAGVCVPDPLHGGCVAPFHDSSDKNFGGPHGAPTAVSDIDGGRMDGFVGQAEKGLKCSGTEPGCSPCNASETQAKGTCIDAMGYHDAREIPNYWTYAENFVLQDNMYEPNSSWSWPEHLFLVSAWSATCADWNDPMSCLSRLEGPPSPYLIPNPYSTKSLPWTDVTFLLHRAGVSWAYYVFEGAEPDCESDEATTCAPVQQGPKTPGIWNPLPDFADVKQDNQLQNIQSLTSFYTAVHEQGGCGLPSVSWINPNGKVSEHPPSLLSKGQAYVTTLINAIMRSPCWNSTAIFLSWDDWGGFYDHVVPPNIDQNGYGLRVPGLVISPYAKAGYIDHQQLSHDAYLKFIEDDFLSGERLNPKTDGRPDSRPDVREEAPGLGSLESDFNFNQPPSSPLILSTHPAPGPASNPPVYVPPPSSGVAAANATPLLQLIAVVARRQDLRLHHGRIYLTVGCNMACSIDAHGHLNLHRHRRHLGLRRTRTELAAHRTTRIALSLSRPNLAAVRRALRRHRPVKASIEVDATGINGPRQSYQVSVMLSWR
jgi:phospholipase C